MKRCHGLLKKCRNKPYCKITWSVLTNKGVIDREPMWVCSKHWVNAQILVNAKRIK